MRTPRGEPRRSTLPRLGIATQACLEFSHGPSLQRNLKHSGESEAKKGILTAGGRELDSFHPLTWIQFELEAPVGKNAFGSWTLRYTPAGGKTVTLEKLPPQKGGGTELRRVGFINPGTEPTRAWLDNIVIDSQQPPPQPSLTLIRDAESQNQEHNNPECEADEDTRILEPRVRGGFLVSPDFENRPLAPKSAQENKDLSRPEQQDVDQKKENEFDQYASHRAQ
jgi:hypothetical protein